MAHTQYAEPYITINKFMNYKIIILLILILSFASCQNRTWQKEETIKLDYKVEGLPIYYETKYALIKFSKNDVIENIEEFLTEHEQYDRRVFLKHLKQTNDTIRLTPDTIFSYVLDTVLKSNYQLGQSGDTIIQVRDTEDERNYYIEPMFWSAYDLIREGKCEIISKLDSSRVNRFTLIYNHVPLNTEYTEFYFENDTMFFYVLTQIGL